MLKSVKIGHFGTLLGTIFFFTARVQRDCCAFWHGKCVTKVLLCVTLRLMVSVSSPGVQNTGEFCFFLLVLTAPSALPEPDRLPLPVPLAHLGPHQQQDHRPLRAAPGRVPGPRARRQALSRGRKFETFLRATSPTPHPWFNEEAKEQGHSMGLIMKIDP